jgi:hypothetical protein
MGLGYRLYAKNKINIGYIVINEIKKINITYVN